MRFLFAKLLSIHSLKGLLLALLAAAFGVPRARALEPLPTFLAQASERAFDTREGEAVLGQREAEKDQAWYELLPYATGSARYTRNQYESVARVPSGPDGAVLNGVFLPKNQYEVVLEGHLPLVDVVSWRQIESKTRLSDSARASLEALHNNVKRTVARQYYGVVAAEALQRSAERTVEASDKNLTWLQDRFAAGVASELDRQRAQAELERNRQILADARYQVATNRRALETASGHTPSPGAPALNADLASEAPLDHFLTHGAAGLPDVRANMISADAQDALSKVARAAFAPTIEVTASERFTNAVGFAKSPAYAVGLVASIRLDATALKASRAQTQAAAAAHVRAERSARAALDTIHDAWQEVTRQIEKSRSARAQVVAAELAVRISKERYAAGTANFLDVVVAERDLFSADAGRIEADANLCNARAQLRFAAARELDASLCTEAP